MFKLIITNELTGRKGTGKGTAEENEAWKIDVLSKNTFGKPERTYTYYNNTDFAIEHPELVDRVISQSEEIINNQIPVYEKDENGDNLLHLVVDENDEPVLDEFGEHIYEAVPILDGEGNPSYLTEYSHTLYHYLVKADYVITITDITTETNLKERVERKQAIGKKHSNVCKEILELVNGENEERQLTDQQINQMMISFDKALFFLEKNMPKNAKKEINKISPDGALVTQELIDDVNYILNKYDIQA